MIARSTKFSLASVNNSLAYYHCAFENEAGLPTSISDHENFLHHLPISYDEDLRNSALHLLEKGMLHGCNFTISSATASESKLLAQRLWRSITPESYPYQLVRKLLQIGVFIRSDVVANLFSAGGMSTLYDGCNRLLEGCKTTILPIGRLDAYSQLKAVYLQYMQRTNVNTLFGTPSSIMQCVNLCVEAEINLNVKKIIFTGEMFTDIKRSYVKKHFAEAQIYGLYGHSETGFVGFNTPRCNDNYYHIFDDYFFIEITDVGEVLVTDLTMPLIPLFRYNIGDSGELLNTKCSCGDAMPILLLKGRSDKKFNYMGNLISFNRVKEIVCKFYQYNIDIQIQLSNKNDGVDLLKIVIDDAQNNVDQIKGNILNALIAMEEINEGLAKGTGLLEVCSRKNLILSPRQKLTPIYDNR